MVEFVFVYPVVFESNLQLMLNVFVLIDIGLYVKYLNEYFFHVQNILIEHQEGDLRVYFLHEFHHLIHYNVDEIIHYLHSITKDIHREKSKIFNRHYRFCCH